LQIQEEEKEKIIEKTAPFFAPKEIVNPCEDLISQVAACYRFVNKTMFKPKNLPLSPDNLKIPFAQELK
jgi:hypothetical protein